MYAEGYITVFLISQHHTMKTCWIKGERLDAFLTSTLDGGEWSVSCFGRFIPRERSACTRYV